MWNDSNFSFLTRIDRKMSSAHTSYKLDEAQAIMSELHTIKKAICTGEKERRDLMQVRPERPPAEPAHLPACPSVFYLLYMLHIYCICNSYIIFMYILHTNAYSIYLNKYIIF
jgi:hypothetical protein